MATDPQRQWDRGSYWRRTLLTTEDAMEHLRLKSLAEGKNYQVIIQRGYIEIVSYSAQGKVPAATLEEIKDFLYKRSLYFSLNRNGYMAIRKIPDSALSLFEEGK